MTNQLSLGASQIKQNVLAAMQHAEEMGGVKNTREYIQLMMELQKEIEERIECATSILKYENA